MVLLPAFALDALAVEVQVLLSVDLMVHLLAVVPRVLLPADYLVRV